MTLSFTPKRTYFASANTFFGFRSYFSSIFDSSDYTRIFVLKGGPGTGKSSIMKKIAAFAEGKGLDYEIFYCSSDPQSLDAVTVENGNNRIAVIDGTAPHERDAIIPGAIDELVNLGTAWDAKRLTSNREEILYVSKKKSSAYASAYTELMFSSVFWTKYKAEIEKRTNKSVLNQAAKKIINTLDGLKNGKISIRLGSAFSKNGYASLPIGNKFENTYCIKGEYTANYILLGEIKDELTRSGIEFTHIVSPLDPEITEGIIVADSTILTATPADGKDIEAKGFIEIQDDIKPILSYYSENVKKHLDTARIHLSHASDYHFALEAIYTPCMSFSSLDGIAEKLTDDISRALKVDLNNT